MLVYSHCSTATSERHGNATLPRDTVALIYPDTFCTSNHQQLTKMDAQQDISYFQTVTRIVTGPAKPVFVNTALFIAGVFFLQSPLADYLQPEM